MVKTGERTNLNWGENASFLLDPVFLFVKLVSVASVFSAGLGGKSSCLALEWSWVMAFHQPESCVQSAGGTDRTCSKIMLGLSTSCPGGKISLFFLRLEPGPSVVAFFPPREGVWTGRRRPETQGGRLPPVQPHWQTLSTLAVNLYFTCGVNYLKFTQCTRLLVLPQ